MTALDAGVPNERVQVFEAASDWAAPLLCGNDLPPGEHVETATHIAAWEEFDTVDGDLARFGAWLGRNDDGIWRLRVAGRESDAPPAGLDVPVQLRDLLIGLRIGAPLRPVRRMQSERVTHVVRSGDDAVVGKIVDIRERPLDELGFDGKSTHRIELTAADPDFEAAADQWLRRYGAALVVVGDMADRRPPETVGEAVRAFIGDRDAELVYGDVRWRQGGNEVHATRVAIRRLRSVLHVVTVLEPAQAEALSDELRWFAALLGGVRDIEVMRPRLVTAVDQLEATATGNELIEGTREAVVGGLDRQCDMATASLNTAMRSRRYLALLRELRNWADQPPLTTAADQPLAQLVDYPAVARRKMEHRLAQANSPDEAHRARKAAKRARYVAEFVAPLMSGKVSKQCRKLAKHAHAVQKSLGQRQDAAMAADFLADLATPQRLEAAAAFGIGALWEQQRRLMLE